MPDAAVRRPQEILTTANALSRSGPAFAGQIPADRRHGKTSRRSTFTISPPFSAHVLERVDWRTDLHFQTQTTIDTLDYSGHGLNQGSEGRDRGRRPAAPPTCHRARRAISDSRTGSTAHGSRCRASWLCRAASSTRVGRRRGLLPIRFRPDDPIDDFPLVVIADDSEFTARNLRNFLWVTFTRSNPAADIDGIGCVHSSEALGLHRPAGHRRANQAAPRAAADRRSGRRTARRSLAAPGGPLHGIY